MATDKVPSIVEVHVCFETSLHRECLDAALDRAPIWLLASMHTQVVEVELCAAEVEVALGVAQGIVVLALPDGLGEFGFLLVIFDNV
jgi:hypothetical protein